MRVTKDNSLFEGSSVINSTGPALLTIYLIFVYLTHNPDPNIILTLPISNHYFICWWIIVCNKTRYWKNWIWFLSPESSSLFPCLYNTTLIRECQHFFKKNIIFFIDNDFFRTHLTLFIFCSKINYVSVNYDTDNKFT